MADMSNEVEAADTGKWMMGCVKNTRHFYIGPVSRAIENDGCVVPVAIRFGYGSAKGSGGRGTQQCTVEARAGESSGYCLERKVTADIGVRSRRSHTK